jgi:hypothetical protein
MSNNLLDGRRSLANHVYANDTRFAFSERIRCAAALAGLSQRAFYERRIDTVLERARLIHGASFRDICRACKGLFPTEVALRLLKNGDRPKPARSAPDWGLASWPEPHPIDFDWRFNAATARSLAHRVRGAENVLCVGTPTVFKEILEAGRRACLIDQNSLLTAKFQAGPQSMVLTGRIEDISLPAGTLV